MDRSVVAARVLCCSLLAAACAASTHRRGAAPESCAASVTPPADHHQHLVSSAGLALLYPQPLEGIALPEALARVLSQMESHWNDRVALAELMTDGAILRTSRGCGMGARPRGGLRSARHALRKAVPADARRLRRARAHRARRRVPHPRLALATGADGRWRIDAKTHRAGTSARSRPETEAKPPREAWALFRGALPLTGAELRAIAENVAPYLK